MGNSVAVLSSSRGLGVAKRAALARERAAGLKGQLLTAVLNHLPAKDNPQ